MLVARYPAGVGGPCILGIDPGTQVVGWGCLWLAGAGAGGAADSPAGSAEVAASVLAEAAPETPLAHRAANVQRAGAGRLRVTDQDCGVIRLGRQSPLEGRLAKLAEELEALMERFKPPVLALEEAFTGRSVQAALRVGEARGVVLSVAGRAGVPVHQFAPARIKRVVAGHGGADKVAVAAMVGRLLGVDPRGVPADATDALAVALCCLEAERQPPWQQSLRR